MASTSDFVDHQRVPPPYSYEINIHQKLHFSETASKLSRLSPELVIGRSQLFILNHDDHTITLSDPFKALLNLLIELGTLKITSNCETLEGLNAVLQQPQGEGGLLRKPGTERWHITDHPLWESKKDELEFLLAQLGFVNPRPCEKPLAVQHGIIFGALAQRMAVRIEETVKLISQGAVKVEKLFLLGSKRPLESAEKEFLTTHLENVANPALKSHWEMIFEQTDACTEANAFVCLWDCLVTDKLKERLSGTKIIPVQSTAIGFSYHETGGHRTTTDVSTADWTMHYEDDKPQGIFALIEQPYGRLIDVLAGNVITNAKKATGDLIMQRLANTTFHLEIIQPRQTPLMGVRLDEIARNVYCTLGMVKYVETL